jgi:hypothetical protein
MAASALRDLATGDADCAAPSALTALADHVDAAGAAGLAFGGAGSAGAAAPPLVSRRAHAMHAATLAHGGPIGAFRTHPPTQAVPPSSFRFHDVAHALPPPSSALGDWASDYLAIAQPAPPPASLADPLEAYWSTAATTAAPPPPVAAWADDYLHQQQETATLEHAYAAATWADEFSASTTGPVSADAAPADAAPAATESIPQLAAQVVANVGNSKVCVG